MHNKTTIFSVINGKVGYSIDGNIRINRWHTLNGQLNVLANSTRFQFEYEERRNWYTMKIKKLSREDEGIWRCRMVVWFEDKKLARRYESRKKVDVKNRSEFFTFKVSMFF